MDILDIALASKLAKGKSDKTLQMIDELLTHYRHLQKISWADEIFWGVSDLTDNYAPEDEEGTILAVSNDGEPPLSLYQSDGLNWVFLCEVKPDTIYIDNGGALFRWEEGNSNFTDLIPPEHHLYLNTVTITVTFNDSTITPTNKLICFSLYSSYALSSNTSALNYCFSHGTSVPCYGTSFSKDDIEICPVGIKMDNGTFFLVGNNGAAYSLRDNMRNMSTAVKQIF